MFGSGYFSGKRVFSLTAIIVAAVFFSQLAACVAGTRVASDDVVQAESTYTPSAEKAEKYGVVDVTNYYNRKSADYPRAVPGLAVFETENFIGSGNCSVCHEQ